MILEEDTDSELESTLRMRLFDVERRRYENARWWRNLNRWMNPLGLVILTIVVCGLFFFALVNSVNVACESNALTDHPSCCGDDCRLLNWPFYLSSPIRADEALPTSDPF